MFALGQFIVAALITAAPASKSTPPVPEVKVEGVVVPRTLDVAGTRLMLGGVGTRIRFMFKIYVAALYAEQPTRDPEKWLEASQLRHVRLTLLRDVERDRMIDAFRRGIEMNTGDDSARWLERFAPFFGAFRDVKQGEVVDLTLVPKKGISVKASGQTAVVLGDDASRVLMSIWLGAHPVDPELKAELLSALTSEDGGKRR